MNSTPPDDRLTISLEVNGQPVTQGVPARVSLVDFLRYDLGLTGSHVGCEHGICGACSVVVDGDVVRGCLMLAVQANGKSVETIEGAAESGRLAQLQTAFLERGAAQCGFCSAGMLLTAAELVQRKPRSSRAEIRAYLSGNTCRCTGYQSIIDAVESVMKQIRPAHET